MLILGAILIGIGLWALLVIRDRCAVGVLPNVRGAKTIRPVSDDAI